MQLHMYTIYTYLCVSYIYIIYIYIPNTHPLRKTKNNIYPQIGQGPIQKGELQASLLSEHWCKNPWISWLHCRDAGMIQNTQTIKCNTEY
jgi:hypothetical protein